MTGIAKGQQSIAPLLAINFVGTLGFSIVTPFLVVLVTKWGGNAVVYGVLAATYSFFQLFGAPVLGRMSDRVGRRRVLILSQLGTLLSWGVFLIAFALPTVAILDIDNMWLGNFVLSLPLLVVFLARAADGLTGGNVSVSNAYLADITPDEDRAHNFGKMAVSTNLGFVLGPTIAGLLAATVWGELLPVIAAFAISAVALVMIRFGLREVAPEPIHKTVKQPHACDVYGQEHKHAYALRNKHPDGLGAVLRVPNITALLIINFMVMLGFSFFYVAFPVHAVQGLGWSVANMGTYFAVLSLMMIVVQGPVLGWASKRYSDRVLMGLGGSLLALGFAALYVSSPVLIYVAAALIALGNGLMWPTFMSVLSKSAGHDLQGAVQGFAQSAGAVASIIGLIAGGLLYVSVGESLFPFAAVVIFLAAIMAAVQRQEETAESEPKTDAGR